MYEKVLVDTFSLELDYYLTSKDVEQINKIRKLLSSLFSHAKFLSESPPASLWPSIIKLLYTERVKFLPKESWNTDFEKDVKMSMSPHVKKEKFSLRPQN